MDVLLSTAVSSVLEDQLFEPEIILLGNLPSGEAQLQRIEVFAIRSRWLLFTIWSTDLAKAESISGGYHLFHVI